MVPLASAARFVFTDFPLGNPCGKPYNLKQDKWIALSYGDQIVPGSFEYALNEIVEEHLDLSVFEPRPDRSREVEHPASSGTSEQRTGG